MTDADYATWLLSESSLRCLLVEAGYRNTTTGATGTEYLATAPYVSLPSDSPANQSYTAIIKAIPTFGQKMTDFLTGQTQANVGNIEVFSTDAGTDAWLLSRDWVGRSLVMYLGDPSWPKSDFRKIWSGVVGDFGLSNTNTFSFQARDTQHLLNQPAIVTALTTGPDAGKPSPQCYGTCVNIAPVLIDAASHTYQVHDGAVQSIDAVYGDGAAVSFTANAPAGKFTLAAGATGTITADVHGALVGGYYLQTASQLLQHFATVRGAFPAASLDTASFTALTAACPQPLNLFVAQVVSYPYALMDQVVQTIGGFYSISRDGLLYAKQFTFTGTSALTVQVQDMVQWGLTVAGVYPPVAKLTFRYAMNWTPQQTVASTVTETRRAQLVTNGPTVTLANPNAANYSKTIDPGVRDTLFVSASDATAELTRRMGIWGVTRYLFSVDCFTAPLRSNLGDVVTLTHPRYGLSTGSNGVVVEVKQRPSKKRIELGVLL